MSIRSPNILYLLALFLLLLSCGTNDLPGKWKPTIIKHAGRLEWEKSYTINLYDTDSLRRFLTNKLLIDDRLGYTNDDNQLSVVDSSLVWKHIDSIIRRFQAANIDLKNDSIFLMISNGVILPHAIPGWHFGDTLAGKWFQKNDTLTLAFEDNNTDLAIQYRIVQLDKHVLVLKELLYGKEMAPDLEMRFERQ